VVITNYLVFVSFFRGHPQLNYDKCPKNSISGLVCCIRQCSLPMAHPTLTMAREGTPQNFALWKGGTK
jgi:hypothetical protein